MHDVCAASRSIYSSIVMPPVPFSNYNSNICVCICRRLYSAFFILATNPMFTNSLPKFYCWFSTAKWTRFKFCHSSFASISFFFHIFQSTIHKAIRFRFFQNRRVFDFPVLLEFQIIRIRMIGNAVIFNKHTSFH